MGSEGFRQPQRGEARGNLRTSPPWEVPVPLGQQDLLPEDALCFIFLPTPPPTAALETI